MKKISTIILLIISIAFPSVSDGKFNNSPVLSMGLSAIIPGAGQLLNGDYKKGMFFFGIELLALNQKSNYNKNAESFIEEYEDYALDYWSVEKWLKDFYLFKNPDLDIYEAFVNPGADLEYCSSSVQYCDDDNYFDIWDYSHGVDFRFNNQNYRHDEISSFYNSVCQNVMANGGSCELYAYDPSTESYIVPWGELETDVNGNVILGENELPVLNFSEVEAVRDYHFHEGLGKYPEFFAGWLDATLDLSRLENRNGYKIPMSDNKAFYQNLRNKSNKEFDKEEIMLTIIFINHAISMFDAFLTSINKMKKIDVNSNIEYDGKFNPKGITLHLKW